VSRRALAVLLLTAALTVSGAPVSGADGSAVDWRACGNRFDCTTVDVPVDYSAPDGEQVGIAVIRRPATDPSARIGSLVINYGGPGDPGTEHLRAAYTALPEEIRAHFDIVSFDPRGTGDSRPIDCVDDATYERAASEDVTPDSEQALVGFYDGTAFSVDLIGACVFRHGTWLARIGTRNVARDLDRIRAALGDRELSFLGYSYGTVIGAVYAQEFPNRVRALVLDSAVNLATTPAQRQRGNARGFESALDAFLADCAADTKCAYHSGGDPRAALLRLRDRFEAGLTLASRDLRVVGVSEFYVGMLAALYAPEVWPTLAEALRAADEDGDGDLLRALADSLLGRREDGSYDNIQEAISIINCADRPSDRVSFNAFRLTFEDLSQRFPVLGPAFGGSPLGCDPRLPQPAEAEQLGDVRSRTARPVLILGVTHDPATPYDGAVELHRRLRGSRVLTLEGTQHTAYSRGIACIDGAVDLYLLDLELPPRGARCEL
jgi:pimeloyl-ACP methyl ester carboxylesterase